MNASPLDVGTRHADRGKAADRGPHGAEKSAGASPLNAPAPVEVGGPLPTAPAPRKRRVLLVDDEARILASLRRLLRREDYELVTATCGPQALELLETNPVDLIISDHRMPGMTGVEFLREVRTRWPDTLRIILSGYSEVSAIIAAINDGEIYKFISKPWNDEEIKLHLRRAMEQHDLEEENRRMAREIATQNARLRELNEMLEQRASDASTGLASTQDLLETIGVGVITVDLSGLVVGANRQANEIISSGRSELIGIPAEITFPESLYALVCAGHTEEDRATSGRVRIEGKELQYRLSPLVADGSRRGNVIALWEDVP